MLLSITAPDCDPRELNSLYQRLSRADGLTDGHVTKGDGPSGAMGGGEIINVLCTHGEALFSCAMAVVAWRTARRQPTEIVVRTKDEKIHLRGEAKDVARALLALRDGER